jgi:hypothetical protein
MINEELADKRDKLIKKCALNITQLRTQNEIGTHQQGPFPALASSTTNLSP